MEQPLTRPANAMTPLWVISLFVTLTEVVAGIAVTQATGNVQVALTTFVIGFPLLVAGGFFLILWNRNYVLYPPTEFGGQDVSKYVQAMQFRQVEEGKAYQNVRQIVESTLTSPQVVAQLMEAVSRSNAGTKGQMADALKNVAEVTLKRLENAVVQVDIQPILGTENRTYKIIPCSPEQTVSGFLDSIYFSIANKVPAFTYGQEWILRDAISGRVFDDMGSMWAQRNGKKRDDRRLAAVDIEGGMKLEAISIAKGALRFAGVLM